MTGISPPHFRDVDLKKFDTEFQKMLLDNSIIFVLKKCL